MDIETTRYVRRPIYVDAVRITGDNFVAVAKWCMGNIYNNERDERIPAVGPAFDASDAQNYHIRVRVHNPKNIRQTKAYVGDWILYTDRGYKIYTERAFEAAFELAEAPPNGQVEAVKQQVK